MDANVFVEIASNYLIPKANEMYGRNWFLHQDNDPKHTSRLVVNFLQYNNVRWVNKTEFT
jgi:hypothetical protein